MTFDEFFDAIISAARGEMSMGDTDHGVEALDLDSLPVGSVVILDHELSAIASEDERYEVWH